MKKVIITGGAGFIGSNTCDFFLKKKYKIIVIDNLSNGRLENLKHIKKKIKFVKADISKKGNWQKLFKNVDYVVHLAALADIVPSIEHPERYLLSNLNGTFNVLESAKKYKIKKFIYSASSSCYGIPNKYPTKENSEIKPQYPYALTKYLGENLVLHWEAVYKIPCTSLRFFNVYGPRSRTSGTYGAVMGVFLAQKIAKKPFTIVGDGKQKRDFTYVTDISNAIYKALIYGKSGKIYNIGSGKPRSVEYLANLLEGKKIYIPKRPGEPDCTWANIEKAKKDLKWRPTISLEEGVHLMKQNINQWKKAPLWDKKSIKKATKNWFKYLR